jgi:hypothetical protein
MGIEVERLRGGNPGSAQEAKKLSGDCHVSAQSARGRNQLQRRVLVREGKKAAQTLRVARKVAGCACEEGRGCLPSRDNAREEKDHRFGRQGNQRCPVRTRRSEQHLGLTLCGDTIKA